MGKVNAKWAGLLGLQVVVGAALLWFPPEGVADASTWGWTLLSMALGHGQAGLRDVVGDASRLLALTAARKGVELAPITRQRQTTIAVIAC